MVTETFPGLASKKTYTLHLRHRIKIVLMLQKKCNNQRVAIFELSNIIISFDIFCQQEFN
jgi:hypothetical protein